MAHPEQIEIPPERLRRRLDPDKLPFDTTAEVAPLDATIGQPRALEAIGFGVGIRTFGYNLFVAGEAGSGRETTARTLLERAAAEQPAPDDWVYVHDFAQPDRPRAIRVPAGQGRELARDMEAFLEAARESIPRALESEDAARVQEKAVAEPARHGEELNRELQDFARERGFGIQTTQAGIAAVPLAEGRPLTPEELERVPEDERAEIERRGEEVKERVESGLRELRRLEKEAGERTTQASRDVALRTIAPRLDELRGKYRDQAGVVAWLDELRDDVPDHVPDFRPARAQHGQGDNPLEQIQGAQREEHLGRYQVNVLVDNSECDGAPVVVERNPTFYNLVGRIDFRPAFGTMVTDVRQLKPGALQRANGGFLLLDALEVLTQPFAWHALKRALRSREARIENLAEQLSPVPSSTLRPEPVPLDLKVVLIGPPLLYQLLYALDEDFQELFKVKVDFAPDMDWTDETAGGYAAFLSRCVERASLRHFHRSAVAGVIEHGARLRDDQHKLSTRLRDIADVACEASFWAGEADHDVVLAEHVDRAIAQRRRRSDLLEERVRELIRDGTVMIDTEGAKPGQVNGLGVIELGDHRFGRPTRITASVSVGAAGVESIEREVELSDPIHNKGVLTLSGFLAARYAQQFPLALRATITLEQSYEEIGGDSASAAELYALLSALAGVPARQDIAITGAVNQRGEMQPVGAVTRKVEGFYAACRVRGLSGDQGVILPRTNARHLMLDREVVEAAEGGEFHVWAVDTVDQGMELLTGRPAGARGDDGVYPDGSVNRLVEDRLRGFAERLQAFGAQADGRVAARSGQPGAHR